MEEEEEEKDEEEKEVDEVERQHEESLERRLPSPGANHILALFNIFCEAWNQVASTLFNLTSQRRYFVLTSTHSLVL